MGNLEKAGVGVVVVLLGVILGVAFFNNGDPNSKALSATNATNGIKQVDEQQDEGARGGALVDNQKGGTKKKAAESGAPPVITPDEPKPGRGEGERDPGSKPQDDQKKPEKPAEEAKPKPVEPSPSPVVASDWPKKVKVEKSDGSLLAVARRVYGTKDAQGMIPAVIKENPGLKPTAMKIGQELVMPAKPETAKADKEKTDSKRENAPESRGTKTKDGKADAKKDLAKGGAASKSTTKKSGDRSRLSFQPTH